jgi:hypothetical protein
VNPVPDPLLFFLVVTGIEPGPPDQWGAYIYLIVLKLADIGILWFFLSLVFKETTTGYLQTLSHSGLPGLESL